MSDGLQAIGLDPAEEAAYELLLEAPNATTAELAPGWDYPERLDIVLARLQVKGLLRLLPGPPSRYVAAPPQIALEALALERERQLRVARTYAERLAEAFRDHGGTEDSPAAVVTGHQAVAQRLGQVYGGARHQVRCLGSALLDPALVPPGVPCRAIYDRASVESAVLSADALEVRALPELPMSALVVDEAVAVLPLSAAGDAVVVLQPCAVLDALTDLFEGLWQRAIPLDRPADQAGRTDDRLVALLLSGLTDQAIARRLGVGHRTVQRRVATLLADLGAHTRFQAGVQTGFRDGADNLSG